MNICAAGHDEVCYAADTCPACRAIEIAKLVVDPLKARVLEQAEEIDRLRGRVAELEGRG